MSENTANTANTRLFKEKHLFLYSYPIPTPYFTALYYFLGVLGVLGVLEGIK